MNELRQDLESCIALLRDSTPSTDAAVASLTVLKSVVGNIVKNPNEPKFRTIKLSNPKFAQNVVQIDGALPFLFLVGFEEVDGAITLGPEANLANLELGLAILEEQLSTLQPSSCCCNKHSCNNNNAAAATTTSRSASGRTEAEQKAIEARKQELKAKQLAAKQERERLRAQLALDQQGKKDLPAAKTSVATKRATNSGACVKRFADVGVDLNKQQGG